MTDLYFFEGWLEGVKVCVYKGVWVWLTFFISYAISNLWRSSLLVDLIWDGAQLRLGDCQNETFSSWLIIFLNLIGIFEILNLQKIKGLKQQRFF